MTEALPSAHYECQQVARLLDSVAARDNLHLAPKTLTKAAAARIRRGIRAAQAYLRRLLIVMALMLEPTLKPDQRPRAIYGKVEKPNPPRKKTFPIFTGEQNPPDFQYMNETGAFTAKCRHQSAGHVPAAPLLEQLRALRALLENPDARARRLALHMARRLAGLILAPDLNRGLVPGRLGTEISSLYQGLAVQIITLSRGRPPPLGPAPRAPPRIRRL